METFDPFVVDIDEAWQHDELVVDDFWERKEEDMGVSVASGAGAESDDELNCFVDSQERVAFCVFLFGSRK